MYKSKYSNVLTIILIVTIAIILLIVGILVAKKVKGYFDDKNQQQVFSDFMDSGNSVDKNNTSNGEVIIVESDPNAGNLTSNTDQVNGTNTQRKVVYYPDTDFVVSGIIEIPTINLKYSILEKESAKSLEKSVAIRYPSNATLNTAGNVVIVGHNYRDGKFFANLEKLSVGDEIKITDGNKKVITYAIYDVFTTTPEDTAYMTRNTDGKTEISLSTCTDDGKERLIILARQK